MEDTIQYLKQTNLLSGFESKISEQLQIESNEGLLQSMKDDETVRDIVQKSLGVDDLGQIYLKDGLIFSNIMETTSEIESEVISDQFHW
jgi:hypothetical protein